jgi:peptidoglycan/LPS O-acetylase OafA/YrhL
MMPDTDGNMSSMPPVRARHVEAGAVAVGLGALLLLVSLFLPWYAQGLTAWAVFEALDLLLAVVAIGALLAVAGRLGAPALVPSRLLPWAAGVALLVVLGAVLNHPPAAFDQPPGIGIWVALGATLVMAAGVLLSEFGVSFSVRFERRPGPEDTTVRAAPEPPSPD